MGQRRDQPVFGGCFQVPADQLEDGEAASCGAARELREETGVQAASGNPRSARPVRHHRHHHRADCLRAPHRPPHPGSALPPGDRRSGRSTGPAGHRSD
ncbi:NUDIX domain-containing protein [Streptomyces sp. NPDC048483]|uniref:NUDIX domain-containing protein n=1 Tax=Streptomyces sp. NPDC048483 TaxID=3154927 RepID=UPI003426D9FE